MTCLVFLAAFAAAPPPWPDLAGYRTIDAAVTAAVRPKGVGGTGYLGIHVDDTLTVREVQPGSPAASAVQPGDVLLAAGGAAMTGPDALREAIQARAAGDVLGLTLERDGRRFDVAAKLAATSRPVTPGRGRSEPAAVYWRKPVFKLAVVPIEFPDTKANRKITPKRWEDALFSEGAYTASATGEKAFGSLADYFREQSYGQFRVEGRAFAPVLASKGRGDYVEGSGTSNKAALPTEALIRLCEREGEDRLSGFDGVCFVYAGARVASNRGSLYFPHQGTLTHQGRRVDYIFLPEGGPAMEPVGPFAHEFAKLLGLPSLAARTENAGSEGLGRWCLMSDAGRGPRPGHLSAWCKEQLGWLTPTAIDPAARQKLILGPVQGSPKECLKVLVRLDGSEYFLLENRTARGFDADLPGQGLLIWRVSGGRPVLEESHGVAGPKGPTVHLPLVPYPSRANAAFTPLTTPSSRSGGGGGLPVHLTNIRRVPDGRVALDVGFVYR